VTIIGPESWGARSSHAAAPPGLAVGLGRAALSYFARGFITRMASFGYFFKRLSTGRTMPLEALLVDETAVRG